MFYFFFISPSFSHLELQPGGRLVASVIGLSSPQSLLTVGGVPRGTLTYETPNDRQQHFKNSHTLDTVFSIPEVLDESVARGKAADTEREEHPASGVGRFGRVLSQLLANLTVDLVSLETHGNVGE